MLPNEVFALACRAYYEEQGLIVDKRNGEFAHCPYPEGMGETGYYLLHGHHQQQGILQSKDIGQCCFFVGHARKWLENLDYFPDGYFELWDIYENYSGKFAVKNGKTSFERKVGCHSPDFLKSEKRRLSSQRVGLRNVELGTGFCNESARQKSKETLSKPIKCLIPGGQELFFPSAREAERVLCISQSTISQAASRGTPIKQGKAKGFFFMLNFTDEVSD
jgi:hypothetical protein